MTRPANIAVATIGMPSGKADSPAVPVIPFEQIGLSQETFEAVRLAAFVEVCRE